MSRKAILKVGVGLITLSLVVAAGCNKNTTQTTPGNTVKSFYQAMKNENYDKALEFVSEDSWDKLSIDQKAFKKRLQESGSTQFTKLDKVIIEDETIKNGRAEVTARFVIDGETVKDNHKVYLVKEDGTWKQDMYKTQKQAGKRGRQSAKQSEAKQFLGALNRAQQAYYLENQTFAEKIESLDIPLNKTSDYQIKLKETDGSNYVIHQAIPKKEQDTLKAYASAVYQNDQGDYQTIICEADSADINEVSASSDVNNPGCDENSRKIK